MARTTTVRRKSLPEATGVAAPAPVSARAGLIFAVTRSRGAAWDPELSLQQQVGWSEHAQFMNQLEASGFVILGGPLEDTPYTMLAVRAENVMDVRSRLSADPWEASRTLETTRITAWTLALGAGRI